MAAVPPAALWGMDQEDRGAARLTAAATRAARAAARSADRTAALRTNADRLAAHDAQVQLLLRTRVSEAWSSNPRARGPNGGLQQQQFDELQEQVMREIPPPELVVVPPAIEFDADGADAAPGTGQTAQGSAQAHTSPAGSSEASSQAAAPEVQRALPVGGMSEPPPHGGGTPRLVRQEQHPVHSAPPAV